MNSKIISGQIKKNNKVIELKLSIIIRKKYKHTDIYISYQKTKHKINQSFIPITTSIIVIKTMASLTTTTIITTTMTNK